MGFYSLVVLLLFMAVHNYYMLFVMILLLASVIYKVLLSVKDSMLLYELKMVIYIETNLTVKRMCWANCSRCLKVGKHCPVHTLGKKLFKADCTYSSGILRNPLVSNHEPNVALCRCVLQ